MDAVRKRIGGSYAMVTILQSKIRTTVCTYADPTPSSIPLTPSSYVSSSPLLPSIPTPALPPKLPTPSFLSTSVNPTLFLSKPKLGSSHEDRSAVAV